MRILLIRCTLHDVNPAIPRTIEAAKRVFNDIQVACWNYQGLPLPKQEETDGVSVHRFAYVLRARGWKRLLWATAGVLCYQAWLLRRILTYRPRVVQCFDFYSMLPALTARIAIRCKVVYDIRDPLALSFGFSRVLQRLIYVVDWIVMGLSNGIVVPDESRVPYLGCWKRCKPVAVILNTCRDEVRRLQDQPPVELPPDGQIRIAYIGYVTRSRGTQMLMDMCRNPESPVEVWAAGWCSPASLEEEIRSTPRVRWWGRIPWEQSLWLTASSTATWIVYDPSVPANRMAAPNKLYESLMLGKPVIICEGMAQADYVRRQGLGVVIRYGDLTSFQTAMQQLHDPVEYARMCRRCREHFLHHLTLEHELVKYRRFYCDVVGNQLGSAYQSQQLDTCGEKNANV